MLLYLLIVFVGSFLLTGLYRQIALRKLLLDIPNERSSHNIPTPRGGGVAIVVMYLLPLIFVGQQLGLSTNQLLGFVVPGCLLAVISYIDDLNHVNPIWRFGVQITAAALGVYWLGGMPNVTTALPPVLHLVFLVALIFLLVWIINLYNFMDGINGIASLEAIAVCIGLSVLLWLAFPDINHFLLPVFLAMATAGFCCWNFPKAKIFMGDIGSCFIGLHLGLFAVYFSQLNIEFLWCTIILLGTFISDATVTLIHRMLRREKIYLAHREHAYQHLAIKLGSHVPVSIAYALITMVWLLPMASLVVTGYLTWPAGMLIAYLPLVGAVFVFHAGSPKAL